MWTELRHWPTGRRFRRFHREHAAHRLGWARWLTCFAAAVSFVIGVVLMFIPGPAILFYALTCALAATQSQLVARLLDRSEVRLRALWRRYQARRAWRDKPPGDSAAPSGRRADAHR